MEQDDFEYNIQSYLNRKDTFDLLCLEHTDSLCLTLIV